MQRGLPEQTAHPLTLVPGGFRFRGLFGFFLLCLLNFFKQGCRLQVAGLQAQGCQAPGCQAAGYQAAPNISLEKSVAKPRGCN